ATQLITGISPFIAWSTLTRSVPSGANRSLGALFMLPTPVSSQSVLQRKYAANLLAYSPDGLVSPLTQLLMVALPAPVALFMSARLIFKSAILLLILSATSFICKPPY